jgi:hypothetical protein
MSDEVTKLDWYRWRLRSLYQETRELKGELRRLRKAGRAEASPGQSRRASVLESLVSVGVGFGVSVAANLLVLPLFGYEPTMAEALHIGLIFTAISLLRSYVIRRGFNWLERNKQ